MSRRPRSIRKALLAGFGLLSAIAMSLPATAQEAAEVDTRPELALMGTIPIYWGEADGLGDLLNAQAFGHWARPLLEEHYRLHPLDMLSEETLAGQHLLLMAQPRALSPSENVALDAWVHNGGRLLLFADPMMTGESRFSIGDRRRPQDVTLMTPVLEHWGLELLFDEDQPAGLRMADHHGQGIPVNLNGHFEPIAGHEECAIPGEGLLAHCVLGTGQVLVVADAALLDVDGPWPGAASALNSLAAHIFADFGEIAGNDPLTDGESAGNGGNAPESQRHEHHGEMHGSP